MSVFIWQMLEPGFEQGEGALPLLFRYMEPSVVCA